MVEIFSPNMLKTYDKCPKKYYLKYVKGLQMPVDDDIFTLGKNIHAMASYYLRGEYIDNMEKSLNARETELWGYLKNSEYFKYETVNTEYNLSFKLNSVFLGGRLDALVLNDGRYYILDYKTGSVPVDAKFDFQTMIYLLGVNKFYKTENVSFVYIDLKNKKDLKIDLTKDLIVQYENSLTKICEKIIKGDFHALNKSCTTCEYGKICYDKVLD